MAVNKHLQQAIVFGAIICLGGIGWFMGAYATAQPAMTIGDEHPRITLWSVETSVSVHLDIALFPSGRVHVQVYAEGDPPPTGLAYALVLTDRARLVDLQSAYDLGGLRVENTRNPEHQVILVSFKPGQRLIQFSGTPVEPWIAPTVGERIAQTPTIEFGAESITDYPAQIVEALGLKRDSLIEPSFSSRLDVVLTNSDSEGVESFLPTDGALVINGGSSYDEPHVTGMVQWHLIRAEDERLNFLLPVIGRYSDRQGQANSQRLLLLSGVLLGVAASMLVEVLVAWSAKRRESSTEPATTGPAG